MCEVSSLVSGTIRNGCDRSETIIDYTSSLRLHGNAPYLINSNAACWSDRRFIDTKRFLIDPKTLNFHTCRGNFSTLFEY